MAATFFLVLLKDEQSSYFNWRKAVSTPPSQMIQLLDVGRWEFRLRQICQQHLIRVLGKLQPDDPEGIFEIVDGGWAAFPGAPFRVPCCRDELVDRVLWDINIVRI